MQQKCGLQGYHTNFVIRGFFRLGWWTNMYEDQTLAYDMILEGHNICLTGKARTDKYFAIRKA
jgi:hypothetical protein